ncbi:MAG: TetR/AcrR family transcriptional regulator [Spirochaetales bacterium]|nr:TetR/AcrR family transcriptional regulator [Leptospiraceae bacterium]MCP5481607.1 TetR/AcrR family transcriptional regulator [Spirochaetales bacterium]MCP5484435.1 TetR/AcrR family transcriptional regulator [Spirochaetales bacterium]
MSSRRTNTNAKPPRRSRGSLSREEILEASLAVLTEDGPENLSMRRIAARLGCSVASPYAHFANQEEIVRTLIVQGEARLTGDLKAAIGRSSDVYEQLEAIARTYWDFARANRELHKLMFNVGGGPTYRRVFPSLPTSYRVFLDTIRRGILSGAIRHDRRAYRSIARTMWAWMFGIIVLEMTDMLRSPRQGEDPIDEGIRLFMHMLRSPGEFVYSARSRPD